MSQINSLVAKQIQSEIAAAIQTVAEKYKLKLEKNGCTYSDVGIKFSLAFGIASEDGSNARYVHDFTQFAPMMGLSLSWLGKTASLTNDRWTLLGMDMDRRKYNTVMRNARTGEVKLYAHTDIARVFRASESLGQLT